MFEVGFSELLMIMALALIVLGPEKLPKVASQVGRWMGRARAMARQFRETLEEEVQLDQTARRPGASTANSGSAAGGAAASSPAADPVATSAAAAGGLAAAATDHDAAVASGVNVPYSDADTRHNDYAGAAYEPPDTSHDPLNPAQAHAADFANAQPAPAADSVAVADVHGQRGT